MDFHMVADAYIDGVWRAFDMTGLSHDPRWSESPRLRRIRYRAHGRPRRRGLREQHVGDANIDGFLPIDNGVHPVSIV
ncbi:hypothetical protein [Nocardia sp. NPDC049707]|uniref:hypothetical protein n=1 Tax=Nocardia sp. NPDC049707 TaxID=3154735 RepID=UPI0034467E1A